MYRLITYRLHLLLQYAIKIDSLHKNDLMSKRLMRLNLIIHCIQLNKLKEKLQKSKTIYDLSNKMSVSL